MQGSETVARIDFSPSKNSARPPGFGQRPPPRRPPNARPAQPDRDEHPAISRCVALSRRLPDMSNNVLQIERLYRFVFILCCERLCIP